MKEIPSYSIAITTFVHRFEKYYKNLLSSISTMRPNIDKIIFVNGQHKKDFDEEYRKKIMQYSSVFPKTYLIMSPKVRGCSFMWNTCSNFTNTDYILCLNDDLIVGNGFFDDYENMLVETRKQSDQSFRINHCFSHFSICKKDLFDVGYFDERLLGFGEEDGDWLWRWETSKKQQMICYHTNKIINCIDMAPTNSENMRKHSLEGGKYSAFNRDLVHNEFYEFPENPDPSRISYVGMYGKIAQRKIGSETPNFYPTEKWYNDNIDRV